jgi:hypothetical protein
MATTPASTLDEMLAKTWKFSEPTASKGGIKLSTAYLSEGTPVSFMLGPKGEYPCTVPFAPSTFEGKDSSGPKTLVFNISDEMYRAALEMEKRAREALGIDEAKWNSCVKPAGQYPATLRVKVREPMIVGEDRKVKELPVPWRRLEANALVHVRGVYSAPRTGSGLMLDLMQMQFRLDESSSGAAPAQCVF